MIALDPLESNILEPEELYSFSKEHLDMLQDWNETDFHSDHYLDMIDILSTALDQITNQLNDKKHELQTTSSDWTTLTTETFRAQIGKLENQKTLLQSQLLTRYRIINARLNRDEKTIHLRDKISFLVGVANTCLTPVLTSRVPEWIPLYYTLQSVYLITFRGIVYKSRQWHYFIFDLCYFVNLMTLLFLWVFSSSTGLFIAIYALTNGPVVWAIITWRNSLVFHSLDKVTSVFIHIFPALVTYTIRWMPELQLGSDATIYRNTRFPALESLSTISLEDFLIYSTSAYLVWQTLYFVFIMVKRREKVESGVRLTSYSWLLDDSHGRKGFIQNASFIFGPKYKIYMFMLLQLVYNIITTLPTYYLYQHFWLHGSFLLTMFAASVWNGASYYIEVFSKRYNLETEQKTHVNESSNKQDHLKST
ncbi:hypothetical protein J3Q64DRAFT_1724103 [Phycomyces blakesleeanus]|uniref:Glycerophosphocholine acyltransferase 1 n=1 Tax=Phycomyces blakesleeanus TaxID=4837 RepID=A0ABR3B9S3_PHYBL